MAIDGGERRREVHTQYRRAFPVVEQPWSSNGAREAECSNQVLGLHQEGKDWTRWSGIDNNLQNFGTSVAFKSILICRSWYLGAFNPLAPPCTAQSRRLPAFTK